MAVFCYLKNLMKVTFIGTAFIKNIDGSLCTLVKCNYISNSSYKFCADSFNNIKKYFESLIKNCMWKSNKFS